ncbi:TIGR00266 family protein [Flexibacter flexilis DSM 6793]|uniref:TIGR00266 family protein n=1 Tax=Flexibacter flexilis DSM 6793 TaxID=927664 RepID=A0A1I1LHQ2_9BACT|nr:TIGR00266 family protein [Flexibacter flexilis]SFC70518.1 TIGR00266 family protein [Flexibacter flexilis DSM 6793]
MRKSQEIEYKIIGDDIQIVEVELDPQETVVAEAGSMLYMEEGIQFEAKMGDGSNPHGGFFDKLKAVGSRIITGESLFMTHFTNQGHRKSKVGFAAPYPGTIIPVDLQTVKGQCLIVQKDAFLCAVLGTKVSMHFNQKIGSGFFAGEGFILQKLQGDGMAFVHAGGTVIEKQLNNETLRVDTGCVVAFEPQISFDIQRTGGLTSMFFGGEGMFLATLSGTGRVWLQSMPISKLVQALAPHGSNSHKESGGILGNLLDSD